MSPSPTVRASGLGSSPEAGDSRQVAMVGNQGVEMGTRRPDGALEGNARLGEHLPVHDFFCWGKNADQD